MTESPSESSIKYLSRAFLMIDLHSFRQALCLRSPGYTPIISPFPRTYPTMRCPPCISFKRSMRYLPFSTALSPSLWSSLNSKVASPAAAASRFPLKVLAWVPGYIIGYEQDVVVVAYPAQLFVELERRDNESALSLYWFYYYGRLIRA